MAGAQPGPRPPGRTLRRAAAGREQRSAAALGLHGIVGLERLVDVVLAVVRLAQAQRVQKRVAQLAQHVTCVRTLALWCALTLTLRSCASRSTSVCRNRSRSSRSTFPVRASLTLTLA